jgi:pilus assembly protein FimV
LQNLNFYNKGPSHLRSLSYGESGQEKNMQPAQATFRRGLMRHRNTPARGALAAAVIACVLASNTAHAVGLGELELRSYLGEPLHVRIGIITQSGEEIDPSCFAVVNTARGDAIARRDVQLSLIETRNARYLEIRGTNTFNEPIGTIAVRAACKGESGLVREYPLLLDPAPLLAPAAATGASATREVPSRAPSADPTPPLGADTRGQSAAAATAESTGRWTVYSGDTLNSIARGIYPSSRARQNQYIAALRQLNPELSGISNETPLYPNSQLVLPDLKALSARAPGAAPRAERTGERVASETATPRPRQRRQDVAVRPRTTPPTVQEPRTTPDATPSKSTASVDARSPASAVTPGEGFRLRVSGSEMDLTRTKGVTDEERTYLRERRALLDADDQTAQILALKNTVSQIEKRLNEMQLKIAAMPAIPGASTIPGGAIGSPSGAPTGANTTAGGSTETPANPSTPTTSATELKPAPASPPVAGPSKVAKAAPPVAKGWLDESLFGVPVSWLAGGLSALALIALAWRLSRRGKQAASNPLTPTGTPSKTTARAQAADDFNKWADESPEPKKSPLMPAAPSGTGTSAADAASAAERSAAMLTGARPPKAEDKKPAASANNAEKAKPKFRDNAAARVAAATPAAPAKSAAPARPLSLQPATDSFELDEPVATEDQGGQGAQVAEDRMRRLRYMQERYPELAARTVSIDDPDSVINAARLYNEENQLGRAFELLTYAVEERPQEMRYWLAQFELFRLNKKVPQFAEQAAKFEMLFKETDSWNKVQQVGYELDPFNPLYKGGANVSAEDKYNPANENWLNAPVGDSSSMQSISHALIADLRSALFREHGAKEEDLVNVNSRIAARAAG